MFGFEIFLNLNKFWVRKIWVYKIFEFTKILGQKKFWVSVDFESE